MITVKNLNKSFGSQQVLHDINCQFLPGQNNLIIGLSGSGKTVLLKCLIGLLLPDSGEIRYENENILDFSAKQLKQARQEIGVIFQGSALFDYMSVAENVGFPLRMFGNMTSQETDERIEFCLNRVGLQDAMKKMPSELSGGMKKRVAIARAIALNPKYLFCDEPNSGLDPRTSLVIDELLSSITKEYGITTIINTHDMNSVMGIGENIVFICKGHKEWQGNKDQVISSTNKELNDLVFASELFRKVKEVEMGKDNNK